MFELTPPRTGRRGRPRKKGDRLPALPALAAAATGWVTVAYSQRGTDITWQVWSRPLLWYHVCRDTPVLLVVVRDPDRRCPDDFFVTTNIHADPARAAAHYAGRWSIEVTYRDTKQHLGGQDPQSWRRRGPERAAFLSLWLHAVVWLWYLHVWGTRPSWRTTPWYPHKTRPSFADALAALRHTLWSQRITSMWPAEPLSPKIRDDLIHVLATAA